MTTRQGMKVYSQSNCFGCQGDLYAVTSDLGVRQYVADDPKHAMEQAHNAFPEERVLWIEPTDIRHSKCLVIINVRVPGLDEIFTIGVCQECDGGS